MVTEREAFCMVLSNGPLLPADVLVVPSGDGLTRIDIAEGILRQRAAHTVIASGGLYGNEPYSLPAAAIRRELVRRGLAPDRIVEDGVSANTYEQAEFAVATAKEHEWSRMLIAVSPYHAPRLFLTFLRVVLDMGVGELLQLVVVPAAHTSWWAKPDGSEATRYELLEVEFRKIDEYREFGHVASYAEGLAYLKLWEGGE